ncbi:MAG: biotin--[acetyl-CoA-carboxylase] ligase [Synechococcales bacterium]|nr:biotin--[acetyl-CoA-carboxylase] ligase [Synechococcales bacterium]
MLSDCSDPTTRPPNWEVLQALLQRPLLPIQGSALPPFQFEVHGFDRLASTNQTLWQLLQQAGEEGMVAIAQQQTAGKGQWGRQWQSAPGGLYLSIALCPDLEASRAGELMVCSAWGIAEALRYYHLPVALKWPNDLVIGSRKLGGILLETRIRGDRLQQAVVGVGINWANPVPPTGISLYAVAPQPSPPSASQRDAPLTPQISSLEMLAAVTLQGIRAGYQRWQSQGIGSILPAYEALLSGLGRIIPLPGSGQQGKGPQQGKIAGITPIGQLRVHPINPDQATAEPDQPEITLNPGEIRLGYAGE